MSCRGTSNKPYSWPIQGPCILFAHSLESPLAKPSWETLPQNHTVVVIFGEYLYENAGWRRRQC